MPQELQNTMADIMTMTLTTKYPVKAKVEVSNLTFGPTRCFASIPLVEKPMGVIIPKTTGTQADIGYLIFSTEND